MKLNSTILGLAIECGETIKIYNYSQHKAYSLSKEQFSKVHAGNFPIFLFACPRYANNDVIGYGNQVCMVKNRKLVNLMTNQHITVKPIFSKSSFGSPRPFLRFCFFIKHCISYEDVLRGNIDSRTLSALEVASAYTRWIDSAESLLSMTEQSQNRAFFNNDWFITCSKILDHWRATGSCPVLSLDILK